MKLSYFLFFYLLIIFSCNTNKSYNPNYSKSKIDTSNTKIYFLDYHYDDEPEKIIRTTGISRDINTNSFCLLYYYDKEKTTSPDYKICYDNVGNPLGSGTNEKFNKIYSDRIELEFRGQDTIIQIDTKEFIDPSTLWFWKINPHINIPIKVQGYRKNFTSNSIDLNYTFHNYLGKEKININNKYLECHLVKSWVENADKDTYDKRWYDKKGMMVKELHSVGKDGKRIGILTEKIKL